MSGYGGYAAKPKKVDNNVTTTEKPTEVTSPLPSQPVGPRIEEQNSNTTEVVYQNNKKTDDNEKVTEENYVLKAPSNVLDKYSNYTYNISLYCVGFQDLLNYFKKREQSFNNTDEIDVSYLNLLKNPTKKVIISKSGVTSGISIKDMEIETVVSGSSPKSKNTYATSINFTLIEPLSTNLFDYLANVARFLGYKEFVQMPMFLEVSFLGYDENGIPKSIPEETRLYNISIYNIKTKLESAGSEYSVNAVILDLKATNNNNYLLKGEIQISGKNVGEVLNQLSNKLNQEFKRSMGYENSILGKESFFSFTFDEDINKWTFEDAGNKEATRAIASFKKIDTDSVSILVKPNTSIGQIITDIISLTKEGNDKLTKLIQQQQESSGKVQQNLGIPEIINIIPKTYILSYDTVLSQYIYKFTYNLKLNKIFRVNFLVEDRSNYEMEKQRQKKILSSMGKNIGRIYFYTYTGQNIDILDFQMQLDNLWAVLLAYRAQTAQYQGSSTALYPAKNQNNEKLLSDIKLASLRSNILIRDSANQIRANPNAELDEKDLRDSEVALATTNQGRFIIAEENNLNTNDVVYAEDLGPYSDFPIPIVNAPQSNSIESTENTQKASSTIYSSALNQIYQSGTMLNISIDLRGDPYWIGPSILNELSAYRNEVEYDYANYDTGGKSFWLEFKTIQPPDETTGLTKFERGSLIRGLYEVIKVKSVFENGKFVQKLEAVRNMNINPFILKMQVNKE